MYRELIEKQAELNKHIKPCVGANQKEIETAEKELEVKFPEELKTLLAEMNGDGYLFFSAEKIVEYNKTTREILGEDYDGLDKLLFFGGNGCGDYYSFLIADKTALAGKIVRWEHETNDTIPVAKSVFELIERYFCDEI